MGRLTPQIIAFIKTEKPDILVTQETFDVDGQVIFPDNMFDCFVQLKTAGGFDNTFFSPLWSIQASHHVATFGNAIFSKYALEDTETVFTHGKYNPDLTPESRIENTRNAQFVTVNSNEGKFSLVNHHAHWEITPQGSPTSVERMKIVSRKIQEISGPVIFAGDFNLLPGAPPLQLFKPRFEDLTERYDITSTLSVLGKVKDVACDHILVTEEIKVQDFIVSEELISDHKALILEFSF
jgi:endonuclease/exonuclease/phosphatase (EEP) superfamily protein YafD